MTDNQRKYLNSLVCERLSDHGTNKALADEFVNTRNSRLADVLKAKESWKADKKGKLAYYIVKDPELDVPLMYFSLQCGELHIPLDPAKMKKSVNTALMMLKEASTVCSKYYLLPPENILDQIRIKRNSMYALQLAQNVEVTEKVREAIANQLVNGELTEKAWVKLWNRVFNALNREGLLEEDKALKEANIVRTTETYSAVQLVHFCVYDSVPWNRYTREYAKAHKKELQIQYNPVMRKWYAQEMGNQSLAKTMFWKFVVPIMQELRNHVGCEYAYLFAADKDGKREGDLTDYYQKLGFEFQEKLHVTKPIYDFGCAFMCQKISALPKKKNAFFRNYNKKEGKKPELPEAPAET